MDVKTIAVAILGGAFDHNELGDNDISCVPGALEELQQKHVIGSDDVQLELIERSHFDRVTAERDALQLRLNAVEEENDRLRQDQRRLDWIDENYEGHGGADGFNVRLRIPVDFEVGQIRWAIDQVLEKRP